MSTMPPVAVEVLTLKATALEQTEDLNGRVSALRTAEIRPQVSGIVQHRLFEQGSEVRAGQPLFQINAAPFKADADTAAAALQRANAALAHAQTQASRLKSLVETEAVSRQVYDDAVSQRDQAAANVAQAQAELARRRLDLKFATVDAPISGRIDQAQVTEGALVGPGNATAMARVQQINQVYVDVRQPAASLDSLRNAASSKQAQVEILRSSGEPYGISGRILFSGLNVDETTGDVLVRILVDNRDRTLLPGMFVRARITRASFADALSVPQQAVSHAGGKAMVWKIGEGNTAHAVPVEVGELIGRDYRVKSGLKAGDQVIVTGMDRLAEGAAVTPRTDAPANDAKPAADASAR